MTAHTLFISDLHLSPDTPWISDRFVYFLNNIAPHADALYILGDLFEYWLGDDQACDFAHHMADQIRACSIHTPVYFMCGNRDFLIGPHFAKRAGMQIIKDPCSIALYGRCIALTHGDDLCTLDRQHLYYRKVAYNRLVQRAFLLTPHRWRLKIAQRLRQQSKRFRRSYHDRITDVTVSAAQKRAQKMNCHFMIHGHTHRPEIHHHTDYTPPLTRVVLGAWHDHADYCRIENSGNFQLLTLNAPFSSTIFE